MMQVGLRPGRCSWLRPRTQALLAVVGLVVAVAYGLFGLRAANAQQPVREYQFEGLAIVDGEPAPKGTDVEIRVNGQSIAASQVNDEHGHWSLNVDAALLEKGVCDAIFFVGGRQADRQWNRCTVNIELEVKNPVVDPPDPPVDPPDPPVDPPDPPVDPPDPPVDPPDPPVDPPVNPPTDPPTDPDEKDDPPTDPDDENDPPTDPPDEEDPPTGPPDEDDPPGDDDDDNDPPGDDPPGDDPPGDDSPDGDPPDDDTPIDGPDSESPTEEPDDEDGAEGDDEESDGESSDGASGSSTVRPQSPPGTGTGGLLAGSGLTAWQAAIAVAAVTGALSGSTLAMARRRRRTG